MNKWDFQLIFKPSTKTYSLEVGVYWIIPMLIWFLFGKIF